MFPKPDDRLSGRRQSWPLPLEGIMRIACLLGEGFQKDEFRKPYDAFRREGHEVVVIGLKSGQELKDEQMSGVTARTEKAIGEVTPDPFDALFIPGGYSPDHLRADPSMVSFTAAFFKAQKPVFAVCHGPQLIMAAEQVRGRRMTAWPTVQHDLKRAGADVSDQEVVVDGNLVTSRKPGDLDAFTRESLKLLSAVPAGNSRRG
jgi:protease I